MTRRLKTLERLLDVYETIEHLRETEAKRAVGEVREAESAIDRQKGLGRDAAHEERQALAQGDRMQWSYAMERQRVAGVRRQVLSRLLVEREKYSSIARRRHVETRLWSERMKTLVQGARDEVAEKEERSSQAQSDERFLAQRRLKQRSDGLDG